VLIRSEDDIAKKYSEKQPGIKVGIWIEQMTTVGAASLNSGNYNGPPLPTPPPSVPGAPAPSNNTLLLVCRAVDLSSVDSAADQEIVYAVDRELKADAVFDPKTVLPSTQISPVDPNGTFTFSITVAPQNPLQF